MAICVLSSVLVAQDTKRQLSVTLTSGGNLVDLTGCSGVVNFSVNLGTAVQRSMAIATPTSGTLTYVWQGLTDFPLGSLPGQVPPKGEVPVQGEVTVTDGSGLTLTDPIPFSGMVRARLT